MRLCDRVTVLRRGRNAGSVSVGETDAADLARRMVGEGAAAHDPAVSGDAVAQAVPGPVGQRVLRVQGLRVKDGRGVEAVRGLSLEVRAGEILGIAGVDGNGQAELAEAILGLRPTEGGAIDFSGQSVHQARAEIGYVPQDRKRSGLVPGMSVRDNLVLELHQTAEAHAGPWLRWGYLNREAAEMM
jgi:simple sugar transport system ATP-binding protein